MARIVNVHLEGNQHFRVICDMAVYARYIHCVARWARPALLQCHQATWESASCYRYKGGPYELKLRFHDLVCHLGIVMAPEHRYYPYRATFDLEACLVRPTAGTGRAFTSMHMPLSISLVSNVPGHKGPYNFISAGFPQRLMDDMLACLWGMSDVASHLVSDTMDLYQYQLDTLALGIGAQALDKARWALKI